MADKQGYTLLEIVIADTELAPPLGLELAQSDIGIRANAVREASCAMRAGIKVGDVLIGVNGCDLSASDLKETTGRLMDALMKEGSPTNLVFARPPPEATGSVLLSPPGSQPGSRVQSRRSSEAMSPTPSPSSFGRNFASSDAADQNRLGAVSPMMQIFQEGSSPGYSVIHDISAITLAEVRSKLPSSSSPTTTTRSGPDGQVIKARKTTTSSPTAAPPLPTGPLPSETLVEVTL